MRKLIIQVAAYTAALFTSPSLADSNDTKLSSQNILPSTFSPPATFENVNLVRTINLDRAYPRETINVAIRNIASEPQEHYYLPFAGDIIGRVGGVEARDKKKEDSPHFRVEQVEYDTQRWDAFKHNTADATANPMCLHTISSTQFYRITLPQPLAPKAEQTLTITFYLISGTTPLPAKIGQNDKQYLSHSFSAYFPSAYTTLKQKTKVRFPNEDVTDYTTLPSPSTSGVTSENAQDPVKDGKSYTYGPFSNVPAGASEPCSVRYEFTKPLVHVTRLERDVEISHWGGNIATEERYELVNRAAALDGYFNRVMYQQAAYYNPPSVAMKQLWVPLSTDALDPYYTDDIGNVSTSRYVQGDGKNKLAVLDLKPRYPVYGDWRYKFRIGWNRAASGVVRKLKKGDGYVLWTHFLEGPKEREGVEYARVVTRIILPEGVT